MLREQDHNIVKIRLWASIERKWPMFERFYVELTRHFSPEFRSMENMWADNLEILADYMWDRLQ